MHIHEWHVPHHTPVALVFKTSLTLEAALESSDPFNNPAAQLHWEHVRPVRGW